MSGADAQSTSWSSLSSVRRPLDVATAVDYVAQIARAVKALHGDRTAHQALSLDTIRLSKNGAIKLSQPHQVPMVHNHMAPELAGAEVGVGVGVGVGKRRTRSRPADNRPADVWALGVMAFALLTGKAPYRVKQRRNVKTRVVSIAGSARHACERFDPTKLRLQGRLTGSLSTKKEQKLQALLQRMLAKTPSERPSMAKVCAKLEQLG